MAELVDASDRHSDVLVTCGFESHWTDQSILTQKKTHMRLFLYLPNRHST